MWKRCTLCRHLRIELVSFTRELECLIILNCSLYYMEVKKEKYKYREDSNNSLVYFNYTMFMRLHADVF